MKNMFQMKIHFNKIIQEEVQKFLNEGYAVKDDKFKFQQVINADFYNYDTFTSEFDADIATTPITITWRLNFILNQQGVENFGVEVEAVDGFYMLNFLDKQTNEIRQQAQKNIADIEWHYDVVIDKMEYGEGLFVIDLDFDFKNKTCRVSFQP